MRALICKQCGSTDLVKVNDVYVCRNCGVKYIRDQEDPWTETAPEDAPDRRADAAPSGIAEKDGAGDPGYIKALGRYGLVIKYGLGTFDFTDFVACLHPAAAIVFTVLFTVSLTRRADLPTALFYLLSAAVCVWGTFELYRYQDEIPILFRTLIWIAITFFMLFDFGTGLSLTGRLILSAALYAVTWRAVLISQK